MGIEELNRHAAVFLDRDGVINQNVLDPLTGEYGAPLTAETFEIIPGVIPGLLALQNSGFLLFLVSNQPNAAKGKSTMQELAAIHDRLISALDRAQVHLTASFYCYHHPHGVVAEWSGPCECRKPSPYFLLKAAADFGVSLEDSWMVGDRETDVECGRAAGTRTIWIREHPSSGADETAADFEARDLAAAAQIILSASARAKSSALHSHNDASEAG